MKSALLSEIAYVRGPLDVIDLEHREHLRKLGCVALFQLIRLDCFSDHTFGHFTIEDQPAQPASLQPLTHIARTPFTGSIGFRAIETSNTV